MIAHYFSAIFKSAFRKAVLLIVSCLFVVQLPAQDRLSVGFTKQEAMMSLSLNQDWLNKEMAQVFWPLVYDQLWVLGPAPHYKPLPGLATHWETDDYKTWRFYLQKNATFSDQVPVGAEDVLFSLNLFIKKSVGWNVRSLIIESYQIPDRHTLIITLHEPHSGPYPPFYKIPILPRYIWKKYEQRPEQFDNRNAIGSGPYILKAFKAGEMVRLERNRNYQGAGAKYRELVFMVFANKSALVAAIKTGLIDLFGYQGVDPSQIRELDLSGAVKTVITDDSELYWLSFNLSRNTAIRNLNVRKAFLLAIDKSEIISQVFNGYAKEINSFIYPELPDYNPDLDKNQYNLKAAAAILNQAGYSDLNGDGIRDDRKSRQDLTFTLLVSNASPQANKTAELLKKQLIQSGIRLNLMQVDSYVYNNFLRIPVESGFDIALISAKPGPYQDWIWDLMKSDEDQYNQLNHSNYVNYAFDRLFHKMLTTTEPTRKSKYLFLMQKILADELPYGMLIRPYKICPIREDRIHEVVVAMGGISSEINLWNYLERDRNHN